ncbi:MAG: PHP domain-containing protein [Thermodesulfobacteriota bacterium]
MDFVDLHCHSTYSDGTFSPTELVDQAKKLHLAGLALTDHDTVSGVAELLHHGRQQGLQVISGVELSANLKQMPLHILGYGFDHRDEKLLAGLGKIQSDRRERNLAITQKLQDLGMALSYADIEAIAGGGQVGRPHFATYLVKEGRASNMQHAFDLFLRGKRPAYVPRTPLAASQAITMINRAGGHAILAHPGTSKKPWPELVKIINILLDFGLAGVECYYPTHSSAFCRKLLDYCQEHKLLVTGGSDFHGDIRPGTRLGATSRKQQTPLAALTKLSLARKSPGNCQA